PALVRAMKGSRNADIPMSTLARQLIITLLPAITVLALIALTWQSVTAPKVEFDVSGLEQLGSYSTFDDSGGGGLAEPPGADTGLAEPPGAESLTPATALSEEAADDAADDAQAGVPWSEIPTWFWTMAGLGLLLLVAYYLMLSFARLEIFRMLLS